MSFYLALVSPTDSPLYEASFPSSRSIAGSSSTSAPSSSSSSSAYPGSSNNNSSGAFPSWSRFTGMNGVDLGDRLGRGSADLMRPPGSGQGQGQVNTGSGGSTINPQGPGAGGDRALMQMIAFKSLDGVEEVMETTGGLYLRNVDKWNEWTVSAFLANGVRFILLHDHRNDDGIRQFFLEVWKLWVKTLLNPFQTVNTPIRSAAFDSKLRAAAKRLL